jgi:hypothetical protein
MIWSNIAPSSAARPSPLSGTLAKSPSRADVIAASGARSSMASIRPGSGPDPEHA